MARSRQAAPQPPRKSTRGMPPLRGLENPLVLTLRDLVERCGPVAPASSAPDDHQTAGTSRTTPGTAFFAAISQSPPSDSNRKPLHYKSLICRDFAANTGSSGRLLLVSAGQNCRVRDIFGDTLFVARRRAGLSRYGISGKRRTRMRSGSMTATLPSARASASAGRLLSRIAAC